MKRLYLGLIAAALATLGCTREHYPDDPFNGPPVTADPSSMPGAGMPGTVPAGPGSTYDPAPPPAYPYAYPDPGLQSSAPMPAVQNTEAPPAFPDPSPAAPAPARPVTAAPAEQQQPGWTNPAGAAEPVPGEARSIAPISYNDEVPAAESGPAPIDGNEHFRGHEPQYQWISGTLEYVAMDHHWQVRYAPYSVEDDRFGGSLLLQDDPRLANYQNGDIVYVEGELVDQPTRMVPDNAVYRIKNIRHL